MHPRFFVPLYPRLELMHGRTTAALEIPKHKDEIRMIVGYAIGYEPTKSFIDQTPNWTEQTIEDGRLAIVTAFETLSEIGSDEALEAIGTICKELHRAPYDGSNGSPDYRPLETQGLEVLATIATEKAVEIAEEIRIYPVVKKIETLGHIYKGQSYSSKITGLENLLNAYETPESPLTSDEASVLRKYIAGLAIGVSDATQLVSAFRESADEDLDEKISNLLQRAAQIDPQLEGIEESVSVARVFVAEKTELDARFLKLAL